MNVAAADEQDGLPANGSIGNFACAVGAAVHVGLLLLWLAI